MSPASRRPWRIPGHRCAPLVVVACVIAAGCGGASTSTGPARLDAAPLTHLERPEAAIGRSGFAVFGALEGTVGVHLLGRDGERSASEPLVRIEVGGRLTDEIEA